LNASVMLRGYGIHVSTVSSLPCRA
jgi:hypothetical protein